MRGRLVVALVAALAAPLHAAPKPFVVDAGDVERQRLEEPTSYTLCATGTGEVAFCGDRERLAWDSKHRVFATVDHVQHEDGTAFVNSLAIYGAFAAGDLLSTEFALRYCAHCAEGNQLGFTAGARDALKLMQLSGAAWADWRLRRSGHSRWAHGLRIVICGTEAVAIGINAHHAIRGR